jgi:hypothetical protein
MLIKKTYGEPSSHTRQTINLVGGVVVHMERDKMPTQNGVLVRNEEKYIKDYYPELIPLYQKTVVSRAKRFVAIDKHLKQ